MPARVEAQDGLFQIEAHIGSSSGFRAGVRLGERAVLLTGVNAMFMDWEYGGGSSDHQGMWSIPLEAKLHFADASPATVVPLLVLGGSYGRASRTFEPGGSSGVSSQDMAVNEGTAYWLVGVDYVVSDHFAIELSTGPYYRYSWSETAPYTGLGGLGGFSGDPGGSSRGWGISWRLGVIVRP
jgi:hypothetical protein